MLITALLPLLRGWRYKSGEDSKIVKKGVKEIVKIVDKPSIVITLNAVIEGPGDGSGKYCRFKCRALHFDVTPDELYNKLRLIGEPGLFRGLVICYLYDDTNDKYGINFSGVFPISEDIIVETPIEIEFENLSNGDITIHYFYHIIEIKNRNEFMRSLKELILGRL